MVRLQSFDAGVTLGLQKSDRSSDKEVVWQQEEVFPLRWSDGPLSIE
jgi:hypothetical protein